MSLIVFSIFSVVKLTVDLGLQESGGANNHLLHPIGVVDRLPF
jgi:hypothetical protein